MTTVLIVLTGTALAGSAALRPTVGYDGERPGGTVITEAGVEHRGELHADAASGCIVVPDDPDEPPQLWRHQPPDAEFDLHTEPWPRCEPDG